MVSEIPAAWETIHEALNEMMHVPSYRRTVLHETHLFLRNISKAFQGEWALDRPCPFRPSLSELAVAGDIFTQILIGTTTEDWPDGLVVCVSDLRELGVN